jgi:hypothetical protein
MSKESWTPWHKVVELRDDLKSGELALSIFAADLYDVIMEKAKPERGTRKGGRCFRIDLLFDKGFWLR